MRELLRKVATPAELLRFTTAELAWAILESMQQRSGHPTEGMVNRNSAVGELFPLGSRQAENPMERRKLEKELERAFRSAFDLLEEWQLIEPAEGVNGKNGYLALTEEGASSADRTDFESIRHRALLMPEMLHPLLRGDVYSDFRAGRLGQAVHGAFKIVEMEVRKAAGRPDDEFGGDLMRAAFNENRGPLTDMTEKPGHRDALRMLFAGSLARFKNPESHTERKFRDTYEPMQELMLASRLLQIVGERRPKS